MFAIWPLFSGDLKYWEKTKGGGVLWFRCTTPSVSTPAWIPGSHQVALLARGRGCCRIIGKQGLASSIRVDPWRDSNIYFLKKISASCVLLWCTESQSHPPAVMTPPLHRVLFPQTVSQRKSIPSICSCQAFCPSDGTYLTQSRQGELKKPISSGDKEDKPIKGQCQAHAQNFSKFLTRRRQLLKCKYILYKWETIIHSLICAICKARCRYTGMYTCVPNYVGSSCDWKSWVSRFEVRLGNSIYRGSLADPRLCQRPW